MGLQPTDCTHTLSMNNEMDIVDDMIATFSGICLLYLSIFLLPPSVLSLLLQLRSSKLRALHASMVSPFTRELENNVHENNGKDLSTNRAFWHLVTISIMSFP